VPVAWNDDPLGSSVRIEANLQGVLTGIVADASRRLAPTVAMAQEWHRATYAGVVLPVPYYAGEIRDSDIALPELIGYEVMVGSAVGVMSADVPAALAALEAGIAAMVAQLDGRLPIGIRPADAINLQAVLTAAAIAHGEWIRIHPFANGNGRVARLWANWLGARYGLPVFVSLRPRPAGLLYAGAAAASMRGSHGPMVNAFHEMLRAALARTP
jgi:fido (protein-threonine AMPylation protein)